MKFLYYLILGLLILAEPVQANPPDSAYLFSYASTRNGGRNGLHFAWSVDKTNWHAIGPDHAYVRSDYGRWGSQKRMVSPYLFQSKDGQWRAVWSLNETVNEFAFVSSPDLVYWSRQYYPPMGGSMNIVNPVIQYEAEKDRYSINWVSNSGEQQGHYRCHTYDFKTFSAVEPVSKPSVKDNRVEMAINGRTETGTMHRVEWSQIDKLIQSQQLSAYKRSLNDERMEDDARRFAGMRDLKATVVVDGSKPKVISDMMMGIFFEDLNYAADGGLYAELIQNRGFEYRLSDKEGHDASWTATKAWSVSGEGMSFAIDTLEPLHANNKHYAILTIDRTGAAFQNEGFNGIVVRDKEKYDFSVFVRNADGKSMKLLVRLTGADGTVYGQTTVTSRSKNWKQEKAVITVKGDATNARLEIVPQSTGTLFLDMISLFPQKTFKGRKNGLRADLAQTIADLHPRFVRFPGGCVAHGDGLHNMYRWANTIGPLEARVPQRNLWGYHQSAGLGYYEYFLFCKDIGAEPVPVVAAGVPCQNSATGGGGQQGGILLCEMHDYVQEVLDLIEYANGDKKSKWGRLRAAAGHPEPFNLKYIGVGNEDLITDIFEERFTMIFNAVKEKYPEIIVIGTSGPFYEGTDYEEGWGIANKLGVPMIDEHYYVPPGWFIHNQDFYDKYDRSKAKVYLGEYAAHVPGRHNNIETALTEALYLLNLERNGDIVSMTSYAPLLAKEGFTQWNPDLIYFNNSEVKPTVGYWVQQLFGQNAGDRYLPHSISLNNGRQDARKRVAASVVRDSKSGDLIVKLVNLLPQEVSAQLDLKGLSISPATVQAHVLSGDPSDRNAKPVQVSLEVNEDFNYTLPAYSLTVIRIP